MTTETKETFTCSVCKAEKGIQKDGGTGYALDDEDRKICYACCADRDREYMKEHGKITLYLSKGKVTNWPGTLSFLLSARKAGRHNIAGSRQDVWFVGPDGHRWHGVQYGEWSDLCHCTRTKKTA